jgi:hypothetical protein
VAKNGRKGTHSIVHSFGGSPSHTTLSESYQLMCGIPTNDKLTTSPKQLIFNKSYQST